MKTVTIRHVSTLNTLYRAADIFVAFMGTGSKREVLIFWEERN